MAVRMSMLIPMHSAPTIVPPAPPPRHRKVRFTPSMVAAVVALQDAADRLEIAQRHEVPPPPPVSQ